MFHQMIFHIIFSHAVIFVRKESSSAGFTCDSIFHPVIFPAYLRTVIIFREESVMYRVYVSIDVPQNNFSTYSHAVIVVCEELGMYGVHTSINDASNYLSCIISHCYVESKESRTYVFYVSFNVSINHLSCIFTPGYLCLQSQESAGYDKNVSYNQLRVVGSSSFIV